MKKPKCFGSRNGYLYKCHEHKESNPVCEKVEKCYQAFLSKMPYKKVGK